MGGYRVRSTGIAASAVGVALVTVHVVSHNVISCIESHVVNE